MMRALSALAVVAVVTFSAAFFVACRGAQRTEGVLTGLPGYRQLAVREITLKADEETMPIGIEKGWVSSVVVVVHGSPLSMNKMTAKFGNGQSWDIPVRADFKQDSRSREIRFPFGKRRIQYITIQARSKGLLSGRASIELWGK